QQAGNRFMEVGLRTFFGPLCMYDDAPDEGERDVRDALASWLPGSTTFGNPNYWALKSLSWLALYRGDVESRAAELDAEWRRFDRALFDRIIVMRIEARSVRGGLALARAAEARARGDHAAVAARLREVQRFRRGIERIESPYAVNTRTSLAAAVAHLQ